MTKYLTPNPSLFYTMTKNIETIQKEKATCRNCGKEFIGEPYYKGGGAYHKGTMEPVKVNFYGGYVCSSNCDYQASLALEQTMPGHMGQKALTTGPAYNHWKKNWK